MGLLYAATFAITAPITGSSESLEQREVTVSRTYGPCDSYSMLIHA